MSRSYNDELQFLEKINKNCWRIKKGFVPNMQVRRGSRGPWRGLPGGPRRLPAHPDRPPPRPSNPWLSAGTVPAPTLRQPHLPAGKVPKAERSWGIQVNAKFALAKRFRIEVSKTHRKMLHSQALEMLVVFLHGGTATPGWSCWDRNSVPESCWPSG